MTMLSEAIDYARRGWYVFPCRERPGQPYQKNGATLTPLEKTPYVSKGLHDATIDEEQINAWWTRFPDAMIGINAGMSGLFVVDIDKKNVNGLDTFATWNINDTAGLHSLTPSGGMHIVFSGKGKSSSNGKTGVDTRGEGGYFIAPPSKILEGVFQGEYKRFDDWGKDPGVIPDGLMSNLFPEGTVEYVRGNSTLKLGDGERKQLSRGTRVFLSDGAPEGERNTVLFKVLADFIGCGYTRDEIKTRVLPVCRSIGLEDSEFEGVLEHAFSRPRTSSVPDSVQEKILAGGKNAASDITPEEQAIIEDVLLACLLVDNRLIPVINDILNFDDFNSLKNRIIYKAISRTYGRGTKADFLTITTEVAKETDKITLDDISKMINQYFVNTDNIVTYADIIKEKASIRRLESMMDNKEKYLQNKSLIEAINGLETHISNIAVYGGVKSTNVLTGEQATELVKDRTKQLLSGKISQLKTGFSIYDYQVGGIYSDELVMLAGRAGEGKSSLALSLINNISLAGDKATALFSLEMSTHETICRLICQLTGLEFRNVYQGSMTKEEWQKYNDAMEMVSSSKIYFDDSSSMTIPEIRSKIRKLMEKDIKLVVIDQLEQIVTHDDQPAHIKYDGICYELRRIAREFDVPIILPHQLNRGITDRKLKNPEPQLADLNQAGEKAPTQVWVICHQRDDHGNILETKVKLLKNRNGPMIEFPVVFLGERMLFSNLAHKEDKLAPQNTSTDPHWAV